MDNSCFYYGVHTANGNRLGFFDGEHIKKIIAVCGGSALLTEKFFVLLSAKLFENGVKNELLFSWKSVSALYCPEQKILVADWNFLSEKQKEKSEIIIDLDSKISEKNFENFKVIRTELCEKEKRCQRFLSAADCLKKDMLRLDLQSVDRSKLAIYSAKLWERFGGKMKGCIGTERREYATSITSDGVELNEKIFKQCERLTVIADKTGAVSMLIADRLRRYALSSGYDVISCVCSLNDERIEHVVIPELSFGIFSCEHYHRIAPQKVRKVYAARFHTKEAALVKNRLGFSLKACRSLMDEAFSALSQADILEQRLNTAFENVDLTETIFSATNEIE